MKKMMLVVIVALVAAPMNTLFAQAPPSTVAPVGGIQENQLGVQGNITDTTTLVNTVMALVGWVAWFVGLAAVVNGLYAGILFITGGGNAERITKARNILLYSIVGIGVAVLAFGLVAVSRSLFGI